MMLWRLILHRTIGTRKTVHKLDKTILNSWSPCICIIHLQLLLFGSRARVSHCGFGLCENRTHLERGFRAHLQVGLLGNIGTSIYLLVRLCILNRSTCLQESRIGILERVVLSYRIMQRDGVVVAGNHSRCRREKAVMV